MGRILTEPFKVLCSSVGEDYTRDGLKETPKRVFDAWTAMLTGYNENPKDHLKLFECDHDQMIVVTGIHFSSMCEHHMMPFYGKAAIGYIPGNNKILGLSKFARILVEVYAKRLQTQERLTDQVGAFIAENLEPLGAGVLLEALHTCMACRGALQPTAKMITSHTSGVFREKDATRKEFMDLVRMGVSHD